MARVREFDDEAIAGAIELVTGCPSREVRLAVRRLHGGLSSTSVIEVRVTYGDGGGRLRRARFVLKALEGEWLRERRIYEELVAPYAEELSPRLLGVTEPSPERTALVLEAVRPTHAWPWREVAAARLVLERVAAFHARTRSLVDAPSLCDWNYEQSLEASAQRTYELLEQCRSHPDLGAFARAAPAMRRIVLALGRFRASLLAAEPFGTSVIHGDLHSGNVLLRRRAARAEPVLIDWARARPGSPLEDVSSWLQSLGAWEIEARRRHDTLLRAYLSAAGDTAALSEARPAYWMAGASNALAGALLYHLTVARDAIDAERRRQAAHAAAAWLRVIRRADAFFS